MEIHPFPQGTGHNMPAGSAEPLSVGLAHHHQIHPGTQMQWCKGSAKAPECLLSLHRRKGGLGQDHQQIQIRIGPRLAPRRGTEQHYPPGGRVGGEERHGNLTQPAAQGYGC
jgi:hypothetical protein